MSAKRPPKAPPKRRPGRPAGIKLPQTIHFRISQEDHDMVTAVAADEGLPVSQMIRRLIRLAFRELEARNRRSKP